VAKHFEKTRKAVLKKLAEEGGEAELALLHDYSERRYFIAHKKFSNLMEELVAEELLLFDHGSGMATLTDGGRAYIAG
jgi:phosphoribosyl-ATP pyrophosphohydrolase